MPPADARPPLLDHLDAVELGRRTLFPDLKYRSYLAHAAISPLNVAGQRAVQRCMATVGELGNGSFPIWMAQRERLRSSLAALLGVAPSAIGLAPGCTRSITDVALALPWAPRARLVSYLGEFPANVVPYQQAARVSDGVVELLPLPDPSTTDLDDRILGPLERLFRNPIKRVAYLAVSAVQFQTGLRMPLLEMGQLCRRYGVSFLVDGIQACGVVPIDVGELEVDGFFCGAHKWMLGLEGAGFLALSEALAARLEPKTAGWLSTEEAADFLFKGPDLLRYDRPYLPAPRVFEGSTMNAAGFAALEAGVDIVQHLGPATIFAHVQTLFDYLEPRLLERGFRSLRAADPKYRSCILSLLPPPHIDLATLFTGLDERGIRISIPDGLVRIAPHFANSIEEMDQLIEALDDIQSS